MRRIIAFIVVCLLFGFAVNSYADSPTYGIIKGNQETPVFEINDSQSAILGHLPVGTKVEVRQMLGTWVEIACGSYVIGFVESSDLVSLDVATIPLVGMEPIGYGVVLVDDSVPYQEAFIYQYPDNDAEQITDRGLISTGTTVTVLAVLGDWVQWRIGSDANIGFMKAQDLVIYLIEDLLHEKGSKPLPLGTYRVPEDIEAGLYTVTTLGNAGVSVTVSDPSRHSDTQYSISTSTHYVINVPDNSVVEIVGEGSFTALTAADLPSDDFSWSSEGTGRFVYGLDFPYNTGTYILTPLNDALPYYFEISNLNSTPFASDRLTHIDVVPGTEVQLDGSYGEIIELHNCRVSIVESNG